jgi:crotonobetainyl-CoA:carnitine CoA-transferase CaiB-like acyl-CoA transferase
LFDNAQFKERGWTAEYHDPAVGKLEQVGLTYTLSGTPGVIQGPPLIVGKDSEKILLDLGYDEAAIDALAADGAIACDPPRATQKQMKSPWQ